MPQSSTITQHQFLTMAVNLLHKAFFENERAAAKSLYRSVSSGEVRQLTRVKMEDGETADFVLALDASEYVGKLPFSAFRNSLNALLQNLIVALKDDKKVKSFEEESSTTTLFGVFGVTKFNGEALVLALSADMNRPNLGTILKLMYLEPTQFLDSSPEKDGDA